MVRLVWVFPLEPRRLSARSARLAAAGIVIAGLTFHCAVCAMAPRAQMDECQQLSRTLRSENARLRDQLLTVQSQNQDYAERAVDDARRLSRQDEAIERLEHSVQAYQDERGRLESAFRQLASSLGESVPRSEERMSRAVSESAPKNNPRAPTSGRGEKDRGDADEAAPEE
jgi:chromosome segregation ATPase